MKLEFIESKHGTQIIITPETVKETSMLLRTATNAKKVPVSLYYRFNEGDGPEPQKPHLYLWIDKINPNKQLTVVTNKKAK